jgi:hypothetical protein
MLLVRIELKTLHINQEKRKTIEIMAVPKKRTSKSKRNIRKASWKNKASQHTKRAFSLALSVLKKQMDEGNDIESNK